MHQTRNDVQERVREQVIGVLQARLADSIDLYTQLKQAHWNVKGPQFIGLHELFDQIAEESEVYIDLIAERITQFGGTTEGTARMVSKRTVLPEYPLKIYSCKEHVAAVSHALATYGELIRKAIDHCDEVHDQGSADIFTEISRGADKNLWFVEAHTQEKE